MSPVEYETKKGRLKAASKPVKVRLTSSLTYQDNLRFVFSARIGRAINKQRADL